LIFLLQIFEEKVDWYASPRIDTHNEELIKRINNTPTNKIFREKLDWRVKPRIDSHNEEIVKNSHRSTIKPEVCFLFIQLEKKLLIKYIKKRYLMKNQFGMQEQKLIHIMNKLLNGLKLHQNQL
jgi:hypothetical protein